MKLKIFLLSVILIFAVLLSACTDTDLTPQNTTGNNIIDETTDPFKDIRKSDEAWLFYGLAAYESEKEIENLKDFFSDRANMTYLTLYDDMFAFDEKRSIPVAEALFSFICNEYGIDALLDTQKRCEYKTAYLKSIGLNTEYIQSNEVETFFTSMNFSSDSGYKYIISFGNITYYFNDFEKGSPSEYHSLIYYSTTGLLEMIDYIKNHNLDKEFDTERKFNYYMTLNSGYSKTVYANRNMYINDPSETLHEAVHAMGIINNDNIWLSEGICEYFGKSLGFNDLLTAAYIKNLTMAKYGYFDDRANDGDKSAIIYKNVFENYTARGGSINSAESFDLRLYTDVTAKAELDTKSYTTLGDVYTVVNKKDCTAIGKELSYAQASSFVIYLTDTYGFEKVLEAYKTQNIQSVFGKDYEHLKTEWLDYLK